MYCHYVNHNIALLLDTEGRDPILLRTVLASWGEERKRLKNCVKARCLTGGHDACFFAQAV
jgi:hypothetical protein